MRERWLVIAEVLDALRLVPRVLIALWALLCWRVGVWFMGLPDPNGPQSAFAAAVIAAAAHWCGLYSNSGRQWGGSGMRIPRGSKAEADPPDWLDRGNR